MQAADRHDLLPGRKRSMTGVNVTEKAVDVRLALVICDIHRIKMAWKNLNVTEKAFDVRLALVICDIHRIKMAWKNLNVTEKAFDVRLALVICDIHRIKLNSMSMFGFLHVKF